MKIPTKCYHSDKQLRSTVQKKLLLFATTSNFVDGEVYKGSSLISSFSQGSSLQSVLRHHKSCIMLVALLACLVHAVPIPHEEVIATESCRTVSKGLTFY